MKQIIFVFPTNRQQLYDEVKLGKSPDNALYGLNYMNFFGYKAYFKDISANIENFIDLFFSPFHRLFRIYIDIDFKVPRALLTLSAINKADVVVVNTDGIGLAICFLKRLKIIRPPVIYAVGLFFIQGKLKNELKARRESFFLKFYTWILKAADHIIYHAQIEKEKLVKLNIYNPATCTFVSMGSDAKFFKTNSNVIQSRNLVVSVGKDRARDYKTLLTSAKMLPLLDFVIVARKNNLRNLTIPSNVKLYFNIPYGKVADLYRRAAVVVIPVKEMYRSSGQMTLTDCMQAGKAIIISDVVGISHYPLINLFNVIKTPPGDSASLAMEIEKVVFNKKLRQYLEKNTQKLKELLSTEKYAKNIAKVINDTQTFLRLVPISKQDLEFLRKLRNKNKQYFLTGIFISKKDQDSWFQKYTEKNNSYMYVLKNGSKRIGIGAVYRIDQKNKSAEIGRFIIDEKFRGKGYGKILVKKIEDICFNKLELESIYLEVLKKNTTAINLYQKLGFKKSSQKTITNGQIYLMAKLNNSRSKENPVLQ